MFSEYENSVFLAVQNKVSFKRFKCHVTVYSIKYTYVRKGIRQGLLRAIQGVAGGMDKTSGECSLG